MPRLWSDTLESHRRTVRDAILDTAAELVAERGLRAVTMSRVAEQTGIGRATLYKYFPDVDAMLLAWHERQVSEHLSRLASLRHDEADAGHRLRRVLEAYASIHHNFASRHGGGRDAGHGGDLAGLLHRGEHVARAEQHLHEFMRDLLEEGAESGEVRADVPAHELARYCLHSLSAAGDLPSREAVDRLVALVVGGLAPPAANGERQEPARAVRP